MRLYRLTGLLMASLAVAQAFQIGSISVSTTATQAILQYSSPVDQLCSLKAADMNRRITVTGASQAGGMATITTRSAHGFAAGTKVYMEGTGVTGWDGWQTVSAVADTTHFSFSSLVPGSSTTGNVGVLVDDLNPSLFSGADQDSRPGNPSSGPLRAFVVGKRTAEVAGDGNRYTRALQTSSRHHYTLTCGTQDFDQEFTTQNLPLGDTHNDGPPLDRSRPGQYAFPTVQWTNRGQVLIDPATGVRSVRATTPVGTASLTQNFQTAIDNAGAWKTPTGPLNSGGAATFTGPCQSGNCALLLRADDLSLPGGATYTYGYGVGSSLDWVTVAFSNASINNASCAGDDCKIAVCLTVNGVACTSAERDVSLTRTAASYTVGSTTPIDLWQGSGAPGIASPDVSRATGTVNYTTATRNVAWVSGSKFSVKWAPGSRIMVAGSEYQIASIQSELSLTLTGPGPVGDLSQVPYSANNFGVLIRKKTAVPDQVTIGYTTFQYGSSYMPPWGALSLQNCALTAVVLGGVTGYNCFIDRELYWISADGAEVRDLGFVGMSLWPDFRWTASAVCGNGSDFPQFDPLDGDQWFCLIQTYPFTDGMSAEGIVKAHYQGAHTASTPGAQIPDCGLNGGVRPCMEFTLMQPRQADAVSFAGPAFNPEYTQGTYTDRVLFAWGGVSPEGDILVNTRQGSQDTPGWEFIFTLGDRTPAGTGPNSIRPIASASSYKHPPLTWCVIHTPGTPYAGWSPFGVNDFSYGNRLIYTTPLASPMTASVGVSGGLNTCPANPFGVTGQLCTDITVGGEPLLKTDGSYLQDTQVGDMVKIDDEYVRIVAKADSNHLTVQRGYIKSTAAAHSATTLRMACGVLNWVGTYSEYWNYRADPYGLNADWSTIIIDDNFVDGHTGEGEGVQVNSTGDVYRLGASVCPVPFVCYQIRRGATPPELIAAPSLGVADDPPFGGVFGFGTPINVDNHPGPCKSQWCLDARPMNGGSADNVSMMVGSYSQPWVNVGGQLWKAAGGASVLQPKILATMAYIGRSPLVDVSGPGSVLAPDASGAYQYCIALHAGECRPGSAAGDVYVNAPFVSKPYCDYPGIAYQSDDTNAICIGPLGAYTGSIVQLGTTRQDLTGATIRRLGSAFSRWSQQSVFWNMSMIPTGELAFSQVRWLDGVRHEDLVTVLPALPASDSVSRNTFVPIDIDIPPTSNAGSNVVVEFGYAENGATGSFFCTSRQEVCVAASSKVNPASPFYFGQTETYSGVPCTSGCTVEVPALSGRILYYRWKQLNASGTVVAVSDTRAIVTP